MPGITDRSNQAPLLNIARTGHGTLECADLARTRRFYEEVLGLKVIQTGPVSLLVRKGDGASYVVVETGKANKEMDMMNHNGLDVGSPGEVDAAYQRLLQIKDDFQLGRILAPRHAHGNYALYFSDLDGNWWEIVAVEAGGYAGHFEEPAYDLTGRHEFDSARGATIHTHDPEFRARLRATS